jgi:type II secretory pathway pseudopilin PulG
MIELVVAIIVMGIAMMTLPMMLTTVQNNNAFAMQQEAILMARTQLGDIMTYPWDENSIKNGISIVLDTTNGDSNLSRFPDSNSTRRIGHIKGDKRRKFYTTLQSASTVLGSDAGDIDDIDDFDTSIKSLENSTDTNATIGYKLSDSNMSIEVKYVSDDTNYTKQAIDFTFPTTSSVAAGQSTNVKMVTLTLKNSQLDNNITFRTYSSNIGANQLLRKDFP